MERSSLGLVASCVGNPVKVTVGVLLVALFGVLALFRLPIQLTPEVQTPTITVETRWPGASPEEIEREIVNEQEEQLKSVESLTKMSSECLDSIGRITMEFLVGTDMAEVLLKVNARLQQVRQYPIDADLPVITTANSGDTPIAWFILRPRVVDMATVRAFQREHPELAGLLEPVATAASTGLRIARLRTLFEQYPQLQPLMPADIDVTELRRFAEDVIEARFERVAGVSNANVLGGREDELQVIVDPRALASRGLSISELRLALQGRNRDISAGDYFDGKRRYIVRTLGRPRTPEQVSDIVVARRDGQPVYVRDVAEVRLGFKKADGMVRNFGSTALAINTLRETGANVIEVMAGLKEALAALNAGPLARRGLQLEQVYDETEYIESAIGLVQENIVIGGLLTIMMLLLFLRSGRSTLVLALAIPISIVGTFLVMGLMGRSLNVISLAGMAFAIGMLVDNAVVVLENIYRHWQMGKPRRQAAIEGTLEVWGAVVASTMTTLAVFIPVLFVEEEAGQLFRDIAIAISAAVGLSMVVSALVIPVAASRILADSGAGPEVGEDNAGPGSGRGRWRRALRSPLTVIDGLASRFAAGVLRMNGWILDRRLRSVAVVLTFFAVSVGGSYLLLPKVEYLPSGNRNLVFGILLPPPGYNLDQLTEMGRGIETAMRPWWDVSEIPDKNSDLRYPAIQDFFYVARNRQVFLGIRARDPMRAGELVPLIQEITAGIPGTFVVAKQSSLFEQGLSAGRTIDIEITGPDLETLIQLGRQVFGATMARLPTAQVFPRPSLDLSNPELQILPYPDVGADLGIDAGELGAAVDALVDGAYAGDYYLGGDRIDLTILGKIALAESAEQIADLPIHTASGHLVPLSSVAEIRLSSGPEQINRRERQRTITIQVSPAQEMALEDAMDTIAEHIVAPLEAAGLPEGVVIRLAGTADKLRATWQALRFNVILALLITYLLMAALFESWLYPLVVIVSVPLGAVGGVVGHWLLNLVVLQPLDVLTMLGFIILIGTAVNNAILIVHQSLTFQREEGLALKEAILTSVRTRMRPIFMTTLTTLCGLVPLVVAPGAGSELYRGLGAVVLGGLLVSTVFTLVLVPVLFHLVQRETVRAVGQPDGDPIRR